MIIISNRDIVELWVPHGTDEALVQAVYAKYRESCKLVVIYRSGKNDLTTETQALLSANLQ